MSTVPASSVRPPGQVRVYRIGVVGIQRAKHQVAFDAARPGGLEQLYRPAVVHGLLALGAAAESGTRGEDGRMDEGGRVKALSVVSKDETRVDPPTAAIRPRLVHTYNRCRIRIKVLAAFMLRLPLL